MFLHGKNALRKQLMFIQGRMKKILIRVIRLLKAPFIFVDFIIYSFLDKNNRFFLPLAEFYPQLRDKTIKTSFDRHYVYHAAWAVRKVKEINPAVHFDISSTLFFSATLSAFIPVKFFDYRPADIVLPDLASLQADLLSLPFADNSVSSLSCMHVVEHVGLGRYGDKIDPDGDIMAISELKRVLAPGGSLLFVAPIGKQAIIQFNAHRIYTYDMVRELFSDLTLKEFSLIPERSGSIIVNAAQADVEKENYACGCFWFKKNNQ